MLNFFNKLKRMILAKVKVRPNDSNEIDYNLALADYLYQELKSAGLKTKKRDASVQVSLDNTYQGKYSQVVIDCVAGKMYLRGDGYKDNYWGKLRRFNGGHVADAYHCVAQSATRIINRIRAIDNEDKTILATPCIIDRRHSIIDKRTKINVNASCNRVTIIKRVDKRAIYAFVSHSRIVARAENNRYKTIYLQDCR